MALLLLPAVASAQETAGEDGPKSQSIRAVERGLFVKADAGVGIVATTTINDRKYGLTAPILGIFAGYDIIPILNLAVGLNVMSASSDPTADGQSAPIGDLLWLMPQLRVQFAVITTERNFLWVRAHGGWGFGLPGKIEVGGTEMDHGGHGPVFGGAVGFERFTKLRHFSIGIHAGVDVVTKPGIALAISIVPSVKYTF